MTRPASKPKVRDYLRDSHRKRSTELHELWRVPEVVELILIQLPMLDLLLSQQVCSNWREIVTTAPSLQQALFFKARSSPSSAPDDAETSTSNLEINPLLIKFFPQWFPYDAKSPISRTMNAARYLSSNLCWSEKSRLTLLRRGASWRRMLLTQPPMRIYEHVVIARLHSGVSRLSSDIFKGTTTFEDGIRMGFAYDRGFASLKQKDGCFYTVTNAGPEAWGSVRRGCLIKIERLDRPTTGPIAESRLFGGRGKYAMVATKSTELEGNEAGCDLILRRHESADSEHWGASSTKLEGPWDEDGHLPVPGEMRRFGWERRAPRLHSG